MKKLLSIALVLAMAATLFVSAPVNAATNPVNLLSYTDEKVSSFVKANPWDTGDTLNGIAEWAWDGGGSSNPEMFKIISAPAGTDSNILYGNHAIVIDHTAGTGDLTKNDATNVFWVQKNLATNTQYTFFFWIKTNGMMSPGDLTAVFAAMNADAKGSSYDTEKVDCASIDGRSPDGWYCLHNSVAQANADTNKASDENNVGFTDGVWDLYSYTFTLPAEVNGKPTAALHLEIKFNAPSTAIVYIDGAGLVAGTQVPSDDAFYYQDIDRDGIKNINDTDLDGDGILNVNDADANGDGIDDATDVDVDKDGIINKYDPDIDGDGIKNIFDKDMDGDYILNIYDRSPMGCLATEMPIIY